LRNTFIFPRGTKDNVKDYATKMLGENFRQWKSDLNTKYIQKGWTPFANIPPAQWEEFVRQNISKEALALSQRNRDLALSNINKVSWPGWKPKEGRLVAA
jgi:hypothetical protein